MNKEKSNQILSKLRILIPNPQCELSYSNTFELLCAVMISAQTTDKRVNMVTKELFRKYPTPEKMMNAPLLDVKEIIKSIGLANNKSKSLINLSKALVEDYNGEIPNTLEGLMTLPGVGRKTASVVLALGFHIPAMPVDTHLHRVAKRLGYIKDGDDVLVAEEKYKKYIPKDEWIEAHHLFLLFGRYHCKAISPLCDECPLKEFCKKKR